MPDWGENIETVPEIQAWVDKITSSRWWHNRYHYSTMGRRIRIMPGRGCRRGLCYNGVTIQEWEDGFCAVLKLPKFTRYQLYILHELAHIPQASEMEATHGREFCSRFLASVGRWMDKEYAKLLREAFRVKRVKWCKKRS